jgi:hypothetical protein
MKEAQDLVLEKNITLAQSTGWRAPLTAQLAGEVQCGIQLAAI